MSRLQCNQRLLSERLHQSHYHQWMTENPSAMPPGRADKENEV